ncbi:MAG TPA: tripartite tricarboxylate transporter TctB family protein [Sphingomicrobium sp.]|nr:tripartite tricarboxylate transporter TctB family protein [Sphingomicrobium sp.]
MPALARPGDLVGGAILIAVATVVWRQSGTWPAPADVAGNPVVMPRALAGVMALVGLVLALGRRPPPTDEDEAAGEHRPLHTVYGLVATALLAVLLTPLGLIPAGILYVLALQRLVGAPWRIAVPFAVAIPIAIWLIFATALHVPLPAGDIWGFLRS